MRKNHRSWIAPGWLVGLAAAVQSAGLPANDEAVYQMEAASHQNATATVRQPTGPDELPNQLPGRWKVTLCISTAPSHAWIRYENVRTHEVRSAGRYSVLVGGWFDKKHLRWNYGLTTQAGVYMDREQSLEKGILQGKYTLLSTYVENPRIYRGENNGYGHGLKTNNCVTYARYVWHQCTGEFYPLPEGYHSPEVLRNCIMHYHPELIGRPEAPTEYPELVIEAKE